MPVLHLRSVSDIFKWKNGRIFGFQSSVEECIQPEITSLFMNQIMEPKPKILWS